MSVENADPLNPTEERRRFVRLRSEVHLACRVLSVPTAETCAPVRNLSTGGLLLSTKKPLPPGMVLELEARLDHGLGFQVSGRVIWTDVNHVTGFHESGISFIGLDADQRQNVLALIGSGDGIEHRRHVRLTRQLLADYRAAKLLARWKQAHTQDISMGGAALLTEEPVACATELELHIHLDDREARPWEARAVVIDSRPSREARGNLLTSVKFMTLDPSAASRLATYLSQKLSGRTATATPSVEK